jgi:hypothetical protein
MARALGVWCTKRYVYLALADDGELIDDEPQRLQQQGMLDTTGRLPAFLADFRRVLSEKRPDAVRLLQPEQIYKAGYADFAPKVAFETLVRLACSESDIPVEVLHRNTARARTGLRKGKLDELIEANIEAVGKYWNAGRKYAAVAALADEN